MRIHIVACRVLFRELSHYAAKSDNIIDITWLPQGLHDNTAMLKEQVLRAIEGIEEQVKSRIIKHKPDYIALGYGLCSNGIVGIKSSTIPIVIPKTDDCIALFLGSQKKYLELFFERSGTFWLNSGWLESAYIPTKEMLEERRKLYEEKFSAKRAARLFEHELDWVKNYKYIGYMPSETYENKRHLATAKEMADDNNLELMSIPADERMLRALVDGTWNDEEFLICPPGHMVEATFEQDKIRAVPY